MELSRIGHNPTAMRLFPTLLKLLLLAAVVFDLGGGAWAMQAIHAASAGIEHAAAEGELPCHGDPAAEAGAASSTLPHAHGDAECGSSSCDCGCSMAGSALLAQAIAVSSVVPQNRHLTPDSDNAPTAFSLPDLRPPIPA